MTVAFALDSSPLRAQVESMIRTLLITVLIWLSGCTSYALRHTNRIGLGAAVLTTACDWGTTSWAMHSHAGYVEQNMLLGSDPSQERVAVYMAGSMLATAAVWSLLPEKLRPAVWGVVGVEVDAVAGNYGQGVPVCGL